MRAEARLHEEREVGLMVGDPECLLAREARVVEIPIGHLPMKATGIVGGVHILDAVEQTSEEPRGGPVGNDECLDLRGHHQNSLAI
jgi:hypothetical protein